jgi:RHS repeat-associated protein
MDSTSQNVNQGSGYDLAGNVTNDAANQYLYDGEGRLCAVKNLTVGVMTGYLYDAEGRRVAKGTITTWGSCDPTVNGMQQQLAGETDYIRGPSGEQLTELHGTSASWQHTNVWAGGMLFATYGTDNQHFYFNDPLGTRRVQTNAAGATEQSCLSLPYGDFETCFPTPTEHLFTGKERDTESGNDYFGARYYASTMGRFMSPDPYNAIIIKQGMLAGGLPAAAAESFFNGFLEDPQNLNQYSYVRNNPLRLVDPTGSAPVDGHHLIPDRGSVGPAGTLARDFANKIKTGPLSGNGFPNQPGFNTMHREYNDAVKEMLAKAEEAGGPSENWDVNKWKDFATRVLNSDEPAIKNFLDELEENNPGAKAALGASIAAYRVSLSLIVRAVAAVVAADTEAFFGDIIICFTCNMQHESVTHKIIYGPPPQD